MGKLMSQKQSTSVAIMVILMLFLLPLFQRIAPLFPYSWNLMVTTSLRLWILIKRPPFIYVLFNFIVVYILLSSISFHFKFFKKPKTTLKRVDFDDTASYSPGLGNVEGEHDTWWCHVADGEDGEESKTASLDETEMVSFAIPEAEAEKFAETASFALPEAETEKFDETASFALPGAETEKFVETASFQEAKQGVEEIEVEGDDTLDATWEAIMEAKRSGPQLKKSDTWSASCNKKGRLAGELKRWQTFKGGVEKRENSDGGGGWRRTEVVVTDHDELKKKSDAFISRFTDGIRLQRLESHQRFLEKAIKRMASIHEVRIPESHKTKAAKTQSFIASTEAEMNSGIKGGLTLLNTHEYSGKPVGPYPSSIESFVPKGFTHSGDITSSPNGSMGCVVYSGYNYEVRGEECAWLLAWHTPFNQDECKVYVECGRVAPYKPETLDWDIVKQKLEKSSTESYYKDQNTGAEASAQIGFDPNVSDLAHLASAFRVSD